MKRIALLLTLCLTGFILNPLSSSAKTDQAPISFYYLPAPPVSLEKLLPAPPKNGSMLTKLELEEILKLQHARSPKDVMRIQSEAHLTLQAFATVLGDRFTAENLPYTFGVMNRVAKDAFVVVDEAKRHWDRPRPEANDPLVHPCIQTPGNPAYPSGHTTLAYVWATLLTKIAPDRQGALLARAQEIAEDRVMGGVHYRSDIVAGKKLGEFLAQEFLANSKLEAELVKAQKEIRAQLN